MDDLLKQTESQQIAYEQRRQQQADADVQRQQAIYNAQIADAEKTYRASAQETADSYRSVFDANAVNELIARRQAEEAIANSNMANSGLNNTQQTAISLLRSRSDANTVIQQQQAVDTIMRELDSARAGYKAEAAEAKAAIYQQAAEDAAKFRADREKAVSEQALNLYQAGATAGGSNAPSREQVSGTAAEFDARVFKKRFGNMAAELSLMRSLENGYIPGDRKEQLMSALGLTKTYKPNEQDVRTVIHNIHSVVGTERIREYIQQAYKASWLSAEAANTLCEDYNLANVA